MARLIKDARVVDDEWLRLETAPNDDAPLPHGKLILPLQTWQQRRADILARGEPVGIWLPGEQHPEAIRDDLAYFRVVAIHFPVFSDGRGYSSARILREQYGYSGELRAVGDVLRDQLFLMRRCGFDSFELRADRDANDALASLADFRHVYQFSAVDPTPPLLQRSTSA
jgi:uncharacterized protein (DUF934 family)